ncbi:MAG: nicotinamide riboside transporter PnuC [Tenuifilaceae bacterium]
MEWLQNNYIEVIGALTGLIYLYPEIKQKVWVWPFGASTALLFIVIFFEKKFYADMGLQFYFFFISIYGWYNWIRGSKMNGNNYLMVTSIPRKTIFPSTVITLLIFLIIYYFLKNYTDSPVPYGDAFTTALSITATWMLAKKYIEMWYVWIVTNLILFLLFFYKDMYAMGILFVIYFIFSFVGLIEWKKEMVKS